MMANPLFQVEQEKLVTLVICLTFQRAIEMFLRTADPTGLKSFWIGLSDLFHEGHFVWASTGNYQLQMHVVKLILMLVLDIHPLHKACLVYICLRLHW